MAADESGFETFFRSEYVRVVAAVRGIVGDVATAEEVAQDAMTALYVRWERISRYDSPGGWVHHVAVQMARRRARRDRMRNRLERQIGLRRSEERSRGADLDWSSALARLPVAQREVIILFHVHDRPIAEIAEALGIPESTVKTRLHRARRRLRDLVTPDEVVIWS